METTRRDHARWLLKELASWELDGVVTAETATRLRHRYVTEAGEPPASLRSVLLAALGALLVGGGVILLVAHNWDELGRAARAALSLLPLWAAQATALWVLRRRPDSRAWDEGVSIALALAVTAAVALIAQTYQVPGNLEGLLFTCAVLVLPLLYVFRGTGVSALYLMGIGSWAIALEEPHAATVLGYLLFLGAAVLALRPRLMPSAAGSKWLSWVLVASLTLAGTQLNDALGDGYGSGPTAYAVIFGALFAIGGRTPLRTAGILGLLACGCVASFPDLWKHGWDQDFDSAVGMLVIYGVLLAMVAAIAVVAAQRVREGRPGDALLTALPALLAALWVLNRPVAGGLATSFAVLVNLHLAAVGILWMNRGLEHHDAKRANAGLAVLAVLVVVRFFDSDFSLLARGVAFMVTGAAFLAANQWLNRRLRNVAEETP